MNHKIDHNKVTVTLKRWKTFIPFIISFILITLTFWVYIYGFYGDANLSYLKSIIYDGDVKPFVYRYLVPLLIKWLNFIFPLRLDVYVVIILYIFTLGYWFVMYYLYTSFWVNSFYANLIILIEVELSFILITVEKKIYDMSTVFLFTLCLVLLYRRRMYLFAVLYPIACLNKETTILITLFFIFYFWNRIKLSYWITWIIYQIFFFGLIRLILMFKFKNSLGGNIELHLNDHFMAYRSKPIMTFISFVVILLLCFFVLIGWKEKPEFLRCVAVILFPVFFVLYFIGGMPFEFRVFAEIFPVLYLLVFQGLDELRNNYKKYLRVNKNKIKIL